MTMPHVNDWATLLQNCQVMRPYVARAGEHLHAHYWQDCNDLRVADLMRMGFARPDPEDIVAGDTRCDYEPHQMERPIGSVLIYFQEFTNTWTVYCFINHTTHSAIVDSRALLLHALLRFAHKAELPRLQSMAQHLTNETRLLQK